MEYIPPFADTFMSGNREQPKTLTPSSPSLACKSSPGSFSGGSKADPTPGTSGFSCGCFASTSPTVVILPSFVSTGIRDSVSSDIFAATRSNPGSPLTLIPSAFSSS